MMLTAYGHFVRTGGEVVADAGATAIADAYVDDFSPFVAEELIANGSATAVDDWEYGLAAAHADSYALNPTPIDETVVVPQVSTATTAMNSTTGWASASSGSGAAATGEYQYHVDPSFPNDLVFRGHLFIAGGAAYNEYGGIGHFYLSASTDDAEITATFVFEGMWYVTINVPGYPQFEGLVATDSINLHYSYEVPITDLAFKTFETINNPAYTRASSPEFEMGTVVATGATAVWGYVTAEGEDLDDGDFDGDGDVDGDDFDFWESGSPPADANKDGKVNDIDLGVWAANTSELVVSSELDTVDGLYGPGQLTLREALALAKDVNHPGHDRIFFAPYVDNITLTNGPLTFDSTANPVTIHGLGADRLTINASGTSAFTSLNAQSYSVKIQGIKLTGAVYAAINSLNSSSLNLDSVEITGNRRGVVYSNSNGTLTISNSAIVENSGQALRVSNSVANLYNSTISGNQEPTPLEAAGIVVISSSVTLTNVTVTNNRADKNRVSGTSTSIGGILTGPSSTVTMHNTIVVGNFAGAPTNSVAADLGRSGTVIGGFGSTSSYNLIGSSPTGAFPSGNYNQLGVVASDVGLLALADNGGPTRTHRLSNTSIAIDGGDDSKAEALALLFDQRGRRYARIFDGDFNSVDSVDIGAFELAWQDFLAV